MRFSTTVFTILFVATVSAAAFGIARPLIGEGERHARLAVERGG